MSATVLYQWLSTAPPCLFHSGSDAEHDIGNFLPDERIYRFVIALWHKTADDLEAYSNHWQRQRPQHRVFHLVNDFSVGRELQARGIPVVFANHNCFIDETAFTIQPHVEKVFDLIYSARMAPFKRHELLVNARNALLVGGVVAQGDSWERFQEVQQLLPQAHFTHAEENRHLRAAEMASLMNAAHVGVCLSDVEGAMYSATEYLLCGLPVVSTPSLGGRDQWFDPRFTRIVPAEPQAVANAVQELMQQKICPDFIRNATLDRITQQRQQFINAGQAIYTAERAGRDFARDFYLQFNSQLGHWLPAADVLQHRPAPAG